MKNLNVFDYVGGACSLFLIAGCIFGMYEILIVCKICLAISGICFILLFCDVESPNNKHHDKI